MNDFGAEGLNMQMRRGKYMEESKNTNLKNTETGAEKRRAKESDETVTGRIENRMEVTLGRKIVVVDLEMCEVARKDKPKEYKNKHEVIQIGAVVVNEDNTLGATFTSYVCPQYGKIDPFIENLTGITEKDVAKAPGFEEALQAFLEWAPEGALFASWSRSDDSQLRKEAKQKGIESEKLTYALKNWLDFQAVFDGKIAASKHYALWEALYAAGIESKGKEHDGLADAYNTAQLIAKMRREPDLKLIPIYENIRTGEHETLTVSLGDLFAQLQINVD